MTIVRHHFIEVVYRRTSSRSQSCRVSWTAMNAPRTKFRRNYYRSRHTLMLSVLIEGDTCTGFRRATLGEGAADHLL